MNVQVLPRYEVVVGSQRYEFHDVPLVRDSFGDFGLTYHTVSRIMADVAAEMALEGPLNPEQTAFLASVQHLDVDDLEELIAKYEVG